MLHNRLVIAAGIVIIALLSILFIQPLFTLEAVNAEVGVNVVYAYIGEPNFNQDITGLWRNYSNTDPVIINEGRVGFDVHPLNYFIVLNITNYANVPLNMKTIQVSVGPSEGRFGEQPFLIEYHMVDYVPGWDQWWSANTSRLVYFSGLIGLHDLVYNSLSESMYFDSRVEGQVSNARVVGTDFKQVQFTVENGSYLYNNIISGNQMFVFYGDMEIQIGTR